MPNNANYSSANTERLPSNIMDLRDEDFYHFIKQYSGAKVAELLAFLEYNAVDYFLECNDIAEIFQYNSNTLNELKEKTCITLVDGTSILLPGLKSSINNLKKVLKKKREEINKQTKRLQSISTSTPSTTYNTLSISTPVMPSTSLSTVQASSPQIPTPPTSFDNSPTNTQTTFSCVTDQIKNKITKVLSNWLVKDKQDLDLLDTNIKKGIDFQLELNIRQDGISLICNCGTRSSIGHKEKTLVFSNIYRHFKSEKCSWINQRKQNANDNNSDTDDEQDQTSSTPRQPNSRLRTVTFSKGKRPTRSVSTVSTKKRRHN